VVAYVVAGLLLLAYQYFVKGETIRFQSKRAYSTHRLSFFNIYLTKYPGVWGLKYLTTAKTCFLYSPFPLFCRSSLLLPLQRKTDRQEMAGMAIGVVGFIPIPLTTPPRRSAREFLSFHGRELAVMGAAFCSVYGWILLRKLVNENQYSPMFAMA